MKEFISEAQRILKLKIIHSVNSYGGYGPNKEVIYSNPPYGSPAYLIDKKGNSVATFFSNGAVDFRVKLEDFPEIKVIDGSFDKIDKKETNVPNQNIWLCINDKTASLTNPYLSNSFKFMNIKIVKIYDPLPAIWYCAGFELPPRGIIESAVKFSLRESKNGPLLMREVFLNNLSDKEVKGKLWTYFNLPSTMEYSWDRDIWYNKGLPLTSTESVIASTVPNREIVQIKRVSSKTLSGLRFVETTCDYFSFIGNSNASAFNPTALQYGRLLSYGAGSRMNRFSSPTIAAKLYDLVLQPNASTALRQGLLFVTDNDIIKEFKTKMYSNSAGYKELENNFRNTSLWLIDRTGKDILENLTDISNKEKKNKRNDFSIKLPDNPKLEACFYTAWQSVNELYDRSYGRRIGDGVEVGIRDKAQDMWPKMKVEPSLVRKDLIHMFSMMYNMQDNYQRTIYSNGLSLSEKLHGMFPRQYPSKWNNRTIPVSNDNRVYSDSPLWVLETFFKYIRETGDYKILNEKTCTSTLTNQENPESSDMVGSSQSLLVREIISTIIDTYTKHIKDSPYGMAQVMFGDWADPIDMIGTSIIGDPSTKGKGRGTSVRLSAHLFLILVKYLDFLSENKTQELFSDSIVSKEKVEELILITNQLRKNIMFFAWEECSSQVTSGFLSYIHEFKLDGSKPDYNNCEIGYTIGSMKGKDFDGADRRELLSNAFGMELIAVERKYLEPVPSREKKITQILEMTDNLLSSEVLGVKLFSKPIPNSKEAEIYCGRIGMIPSGCAENGQYHHAGNMMQYFRLGYPNQVELAWKYYKPLLSVYRDETLNGPFDMFANSYASDPDDPHYGAGMYFGFSGSLDWTIELIEKLVGLELNLYSLNEPDLRITPHIPEELGNNIELRRILHYYERDGFKEIPISIKIQRNDHGEQSGIWINEEKVHKAEIKSIAGMTKIDILIKKYI